MLFLKIEKRDLILETDYEVPLLKGPNSTPPTPCLLQNALS